MVHKFNFNFLLVAVICLKISLSFANYVFPIQQNFVCENENLEIKCKEDEEIVIDYASYGNNEENSCNNVDISDCSSPISYRKVREMCNFKSSCVVTASDSIFGGNPCEGVLKFLKIKWRCIPSDRIFNKEEVICHRDELVIKCPSDYVLVIRSANFGGVNLYNRNVVCGKYQRTSCYDNTDTLDIMRRKCGRKHSCEFYADEATFGDKCQNYNSYLYVKYKCIPSQSCDNFVK